MVEQVSKDELMTREILSTAKMLFAHHGLKKTTMEDIANAIGKGKSTLYYYYRCKNDIFEAVVDEELKNLYRITRRAVNGQLCAKDKLKAYARTRISAMEKLQNLSCVVYEEILHHIAEVTQLKQKHDDQQIELVKEIIEEGVNSGEFRALATEDIELFAFTVVAAFKGIEIQMNLRKMVATFESGSDVLIDIMVDGLKS